MNTYPIYRFYRHRSVIVIAILLFGNFPATTRADRAYVQIGSHKAIADRVIAKFKSRGRDFSQTQATQAIGEAGFSLTSSSSLIPGLVVLDRIAIQPSVQNSSTNNSLDERIEVLKKSGIFEYVEPDWIVYTNDTPSDIAFTDGTLWGLQNIGQDGGTSGVDINVVPAWELTTGSKSVVIGVVDTGIRYTHQDLAANMWINEEEVVGDGIDNDSNGYIDDIYGINAITGSGDPMDDNDHGTHCAGTIGAAGNDGSPHVGVALNVKLMALKFLNSQGSGAVSDSIKCIEYGIEKGATILSNSWGGGGFSQALDDAISAANNAGIIFIAAAGNASNNNDISQSYPANHDFPNVISVAAIDRNGALASFSNYGLIKVDIGAPGVSIYSTTSSSDTSYNSFDGTSMAAPHVSGVAALIASYHPGIGVTEMRQRILNTARPVFALNSVTATGGVIDALAAISAEADGTLEIAASTDTLPLLANRSAAFYIAITDLAPVLGATVICNLDGTVDVPFLDNGSGVDKVSGDGIYSASLAVPNGSDKTNLAVEISASGKTTASQNFSFDVIAPAVNDNFTDRIVIEPGITQSIGSNVASTVETNEPRNPSVSGVHTVWWEWTAPITSEVTITTSGSSFDTTLAIYTGIDLASIDLVVSNDDFNGRQSSVTFTAAIGIPYMIQINGYSDSTGTISLNHPSTGNTTGAPVIISSPANRTILIGDSFLLEVNAVGDDPLSYQWYHDGALIPSATERLYSVPQAVQDDSGQYYVAVTNGAGTTNSSNSFVAVNQVGVITSNDSFSQPDHISGSSGRITGFDNTLATGEPDEPFHAETSGPINSLWWTWTAPQDGIFTIDTFGSNFDTTMAVYTGPALNALTLIASNDDSSGTLSSVSINTQAGQTYRIAVDGFAESTGSLTVNYSLTPSEGTLVNDAFADRLEFPTTAGTTTANNTGATGEFGEPEHAGSSNPLSSVWWQFEATSNSTVTVTTEGSDFDTTLAVYQGDSVDALTPIANNDDRIGLQSSVSFSVFENEIYIIAVDGYATAEGEIVLNYSFSPPGVMIVNDAFANRLEFPIDVRVATGSNIGATGEVGEPLHTTNSNPLSSAWWWFEATSNGTVTVTTEGSDFDTTLAVYQGDSVDALTPIANNEDRIGSASSVSFAVFENEIYIIAVDGYATAEGEIVLNYSFLTTTNDAFANKFEFPIDIGVFAGSNIGATGEIGEPIHTKSSIPHSSAWWWFEAPSNGAVTLTTEGSDFDTTLSIYQGDSVDALTPIADDHDRTGSLSSVSFSVVENEIYIIAVDGYEASEGEIVLNYAFNETLLTPANDLFENRLEILPDTEGTSGSNIGAVGEHGEPSHAQSSNPISSVWWYFAAPYAGRAEIDTIDSDFDTILAIYQGERVDALSEIVSNDDEEGTRSSVTFPIVKDKIYLIAVDGYRAATGRIVLDVNLERNQPQNIDFEIGGNGLTWRGLGNSLWFPQSSTTRDGTETLQSGAIKENENSSLQTQIAGPVTVKFWWRVSSESESDYLNLHIDSKLFSRISGETDWEQITLNLSAGRIHTLLWSYDKDDGLSNGLDAGWIDQLEVANLALLMRYRRSKIPSDPIAIPQWSTDLSNWKLSGETIKTTRVLLNERVIDSSHPDYDIVDTEATIQGDALESLFLRLNINNLP